MARDRNNEGERNNWRQDMEGQMRRRETRVDGTQELDGNKIFEGGMG